MLYIILFILGINGVTGLALYFSRKKLERLEKEIEEEERRNQKLLQQIDVYKDLQEIENENKKRDKEIDNLSGHALAAELSNGNGD